MTCFLVKQRVDSVSTASGCLCCLAWALANPWMRPHWTARRGAVMVAGANCKMQNLLSVLTLARSLNLQLQLDGLFHWRFRLAAQQIRHQICFSVVGSPKNRESWIDPRPNATSELVHCFAIHSEFAASELHDIETTSAKVPNLHLWAWPWRQVTDSQLPKVCRKLDVQECRKLLNSNWAAMQLCAEPPWMKGCLGPWPKLMPTCTQMLAEAKDCSTYICTFCHDACLKTNLTNLMPTFGQLRQTFVFCSLWILQTLAFCCALVSPMLCCDLTSK